MKPRQENVKEPTTNLETLQGILPGGPIFNNPYPENDLRSSILAPYFSAMAKFRRLADEYPTLSANWKAYYPTWSFWPPSKRFADGSKKIPSAPGAEAHVERGAGQAAEELLGFSSYARASAVRTWLNPGRDRWLDAGTFKSWELWLYAIREFWLKAAEEARASDADIDGFERMAEANGYFPGHSTPIGQHVWSTMVARVLSLKGAMKELGLSTGQELDCYEEPVAWIHDGAITYVFRSFAYFCGVLAARRVLELKERDASGGTPDDVSYQGAPAFAYRYPEDFPAAGQFAIEQARLAANKQLESKGSRSFEEHISARIDWFWDLVSVAASALGEIEVNACWSIQRRRDVLSDFGFSAAAAVGMPDRRLQKLMNSDRWSVLNERLIPVPKSISPGTVVSSASRVPNELKSESKTQTSNRQSLEREPRPETLQPDKGNLALLRGPDGEQKELVNLDVAARFGGVGKRAIQRAITKGALESQGTHANRRVIVRSLLAYFPPEK